MPSAQVSNSGFIQPDISTALNCTTLHCTVLYCGHCTALHCTSQHCTADTALQYSAVHYPAEHCTALSCTPVTFTLLPFSVLHWNHFSAVLLFSALTIAPDCHRFHCEGMAEFNLTTLDPLLVSLFITLF